MLEGNEFEKQLGKYGSVVVDITDELKVKATVVLKVDAVEELKKLAEQSKSEVFKKVVGFIVTFVAPAAITQPADEDDASDKTAITKPKA